MPVSAGEHPALFHLSATFDACRTEPRASLEAYGLHDYDAVEDERGAVARWGTPILGDRILRAGDLLVLIAEEGLESLAPRLDGSFLIVRHDRIGRRMEVVNDRFASLPLFYVHAHGRFACSSSFKRLFDQRGAVSSPTLDPWAVLEFLWFRRLFGERTYDSAIRFLPYASILALDGSGRVHLRRYWHPSADKLDADPETVSERIAAAIHDSVRALMSDGRRYGLMLSGGLDARAILAAAPLAPVCVTTSPRANNEVAVARQLASIRSAEHHYIPRPADLLDDKVDVSVAIGGG